MHGDERAIANRRHAQPAAIPLHPRGGPKDGLRRGATEEDEETRLNAAKLGEKPRLAGGHFTRSRFLMQTPFAAGDVLEVLHRIGDIDGAAIDARVIERAVEKLSRRADERMALNVFAIAGLLADDHDGRMRRTFAENRLGGVFVKRTGGAAGRSRTEFAKTLRVGDDRGLSLFAR